MAGWVLGFMAGPGVAVGLGSFCQGLLCLLLTFAALSEGMLLPGLFFLVAAVLYLSCMTSWQRRRLTGVAFLRGLVARAYLISAVLILLAMIVMSIHEGSMPPLIILAVLLLPPAALGLIEALVRRRGLGLSQTRLPERGQSDEAHA